MESHEATSALESLHRRMRKEQHLKTLLGTKRSPERKLKDVVFGDSVGIKSEFLITPDQQELLNEAIAKVENVLLEKGTTGTELWQKDSASWTMLEGFTEEERKNLYVYEAGAIMVTGLEDLEKVPKDFPAILVTTHGDDDISLSFDIKKNTFELEIAFDKPRILYFSGTKPLDQMTVEEYDISCDVLNRIIFQSISDNQSVTP